MKKIALIILFACICFAWGQEYIEINCERELNNGSSEKTNIRLDFDKNGYLSRYLNTTHVGENVITKEIQGKWDNENYELNIDIRNDIYMDPHNLNVIYVYKKTDYGWDEYNLRTEKLLRKVRFIYNPALEIQEDWWNGNKTCIFKQNTDSIMLYNNEFKKINGFYVKTNLDVEYGEKIIFSQIDKKHFRMDLFYEGRIIEYTVEHNYECKNYEQIEFLYTLRNWGVPEELMPFIVVCNSVTYHATSYLTEGSTTYEPEHLQQKDGLPWASGNGTGIGDVISIKEFEHKNPTTLKIMNGYQDPNHPDYYEKNSRVKKIKVTNTDTKKSKKLTVQDIKTEQTFDISALGNGRTFEVEILDVYGGSKYKDLCIQYLVFE